MPLLLDETAVRDLLSMPDLIGAMELALAAFSSGDIVQPLRTVLDTGNTNFLTVMPAYVPAAPALGAKLVTGYYTNLKKGLPSHLATVILLDSETGALEAIVNARYLTAARTAAVSAVSVKKLARPDSRILAIFGSGLQARTHFDAVQHAGSFSEVRVWSPTQASRETFARETGAIAMPSGEAACKGADVIVLATNSSTPVISNDWVEDGAHVVCAGACRPTQREMDPALVVRARLFVDSRVAAVKESGDIVEGLTAGRFGEDHIIAEIGQPQATRMTAQEVTLFKSLGLAVEDVVGAHQLVQRAKQLEKGVTI